MAEELKSTSAAEYRKKHVITKMVKTSSGAVFKIRPISPLDYINGHLQAKKGEGEVEAGRKFVTGLLLTCVLEPKITEKRAEDCKDNELSMDELGFADYQFLTKEITNLSTSENASFLATGQSSSS